MSLVSIVNNLSASLNGSVVTAKQGEAAAEFAEGFDLTLTNGDYLQLGGQFATGGSSKIYDKDTHLPLATPAYWHFWSTKDCYLQFVGATSNVIVPVTALVPFVYAGNTILAAANTTDIASSEPTLEAIDHLMIGNWDGNTLVCKLTIFY